MTTWTAHYPGFDVSYSDGRWTLTPPNDDALQTITNAVATAGPVRLVPAGPILPASDPDAAYPILVDLLGPPEDFEGDGVDLEPLPEGAVS